MSPITALWPADTEGQAYLLGLLAGGLTEFTKGALWVGFRGRPKRMAKLFEMLGTGEVQVHSGQVRIRSKRLERDLTRAGMPADSSNWSFPELNAPLSNAFVRGMFDSAGFVPDRADAPELYCSLQARPGLAQGIAERHAGAVLGGAGERVSLRWHGVNALDLLGRLYEEATLFRKVHRRNYSSWAGSFDAHEPTQGLAFTWNALREDAAPPYKERVSDSGYDLTLLHMVKRYGRCTLYGTGIQVRPPWGWYFDVVPRSSIIKLGHIVANSVGIIDRSYRGEVMVPLIKIDENAPDLQLPARIVQLIPRPIVHLRAERADSLDGTGRGGRGFGSTGQ